MRRFGLLQCILFVMGFVLSPFALAASLQLTSRAFISGGMIPVQYTCRGDNQSPPLSFANVPKGTQSLVLLVEDPDAPDPASPKMLWTHWVAYNIPPNVTELAESVDMSKIGAMVGQNSSNKAEYHAPCPPIGVHRYYFTLCALDQKLDLPPAANKSAVLTTMMPHVMQCAVLLGRDLAVN